MKKYFSCLFAALLAMMMIVSCGKEKKEEKVEVPAAPVVETTEVEEAPVKKSGTFSKAVVLFSQPGVYVPDEKNDGKLRWVGSLTRGMEVFAQTKGDEIVKKPMNFVGEKEGAKTTDMAIVKINEGDSDVYYVAESNLELGFTLVVVGDDLTGGTDYTLLYNDSDISKITKIKVPAGTLVVCKDASSYSDEYCLVTFQIPGVAFYREKYLESAALERSERFVLAAMIADRMKNTKEMKDEVYGAIFENLNTILSVGSDERDSTFDEFLSTIGLIDER